MRFSLLILLIFIKSITAFSQTDQLKVQIDEIIKSKKATVGVAIMDLKNKETLSINNEVHYPMQSVFKFHLALAILSQVDKGKLSLNQNIYVSKADVRPGTWSPLHDKYPEGNINLTLSEILTYSVAQSDNNACDILFKVIGGPQKVNDYIHKLGVKEVAIVATEAKMHTDWDIQYTNWSTPLAASKLLEKFYKKQILSKSSQDFLWKIMVETTTGSTKIKALLPQKATIAHKSGWSGSNDAGLTAATNDIGIITLPNGSQFAIAIFVKNSTEKEATNDRMIAEISKATYDYFAKK